MQFCFENEDEDEQHKQVYAYFGKAVYFAQVLEYQLINMLLIYSKRKNIKMRHEIFDSLFIEYKKKTFGGLLQKVKKVFSIEDALLNELTTLLKKRNYLVHDYFKDKIHMFYNQLGRETMISEFNELTDAFKEMDAGLYKKTESIMNDMGITAEILKEFYAETQRESNNIIYV